jgi:hypothetical protein
MGSFVKPRANGGAISVMADGKIFPALPGFACDFLSRELCPEPAEGLCRPHFHRTGSAFLG